MRRWLSALLALFLVLPALPARAATPAGADGWQAVDPFGLNVSLRGVAVSPETGIAVAVGEGGLIEANAGGWHVAASGTDRTLRAVAATQSGLVAVGDGGTIVTSSDGEVWAAAKSGTDRRLTAVAGGSGRWVAVGEAGLVLTSTDGRTWVAGSAGTDSDLTAVTFGSPGTYLESRVVAVGKGGLAAISADGGQSWESWTVGPTGDLLSVTAVPGGFAALDSTGRVWNNWGGLARTEWTARATGVTGLAAITQMPYQGLIAVGAGGVILASQTGEDWVRQRSEVTADLYAVAGGYAAGAGGTLLANEPAYGVWHRTGPAPAVSVAFSGGRFVAASGLRVRTSANGVDWTDAPAASAPAQGRWLQAGDRLLRMRANGTRTMIQATGDGLQWTDPQPAEPPGMLADVTYDGQRLLAAIWAQGTFPKGVFSSPDGLQWQVVPLTVYSSPVEWRVLVAAPGHYLLSLVTATPGPLPTYQRHLYVSADLTSWAEASLPPQVDAGGVAYDNIAGAAYAYGRYVLAPKAGGLLTSVDGRTWSPVPATQPVAVSKLSFAWDHFQAVDGAGALWVSSDGLRWSRSDGAYWAQYAYGNARLVAVTEGGTLLVGSPVPPFPDLAPGSPVAAAAGRLAELGIITGYEDGTFRPEWPVTWPEAARMLMQAAAVSDGGQAAGTAAYARANTRFLSALWHLGEVRTGDQPLSREFAIGLAGVAAGLTPIPVDGGNGFIPAARAASLTGPAAPIPLWASDSTQWDQPVTRGEMAVLLYNLTMLQP